MNIERLQQREYARFGERICEGGDMYEEHSNFIEWTKGYDTYGIDQRSRALHEQWFELLSCPLIRVYGTKQIEEIIAQIPEI